MDSVSEITVNLQRTNPVVLIEKLLKSAGLPGVQNIEGMKVWHSAVNHLDDHTVGDHSGYSSSDLRYHEERKSEKALVEFFEQKSVLARTRLKDSSKLRHQNAELIDKICKDFGIESLVVESNWTVRLLHGYMKNLHDCLSRNKDEISKATGWNVVLSLWNGVDSDGTVHLNIEDEPLSWVKVQMFLSLF